MRAALLGFVTLAVGHPFTSQLGQGQVCGGDDYTAHSICSSGLSCIKISQEYSQCQKIGSVPLPRSSNGSIWDNIRFVGRVNPATRILTWPGTGVEFAFEGTEAQIHISGIVGANSAELTVDDADPIIISNVEGSTISTPTLADGTHRVVLRRRSETEQGTITIEDVTADGPIQRFPTANRKIEIIGDSISVGYGLDGTLPCTNSAAVTNNPKTYGALAAEALEADYTVIAWSGRGVIRNYMGIHPDNIDLVPELWTRYGSQDNDGSYTFPESDIPDAVVVCLGTNDFGYLGTRDPLDIEEFTSAYLAFVNNISQHYPGAQIFLVSSSMLSDSYPTVEDAQHTTLNNALESVVQSFGTGAHFVDWPTSQGTPGCDYHPSAAMHSDYSKVLAAAMGSALGWA